jgi:hypothetical protein
VCSFGIFEETVMEKQAASELAQNVEESPWVFTPLHGPECRRLADSPPPQISERLANLQSQADGILRHVTELQAMVRAARKMVRTLCWEPIVGKTGFGWLREFARRAIEAKREEPDD